MILIYLPLLATDASWKHLYLKFEVKVYHLPLIKKDMKERNTPLRYSFFTRMGIHSLQECECDNIDINLLENRQLELQQLRKIISVY